MTLVQGNEAPYQDFIVILKQMLQNCWKIMKKYFLVTVSSKWVMNKLYLFIYL